MKKNTPKPLKEIYGAKKKKGPKSLLENYGATSL
jgi:hypothetical protein